MPARAAPPTDSPIMSAVENLKIATDSAALTTVKPGIADAAEGSGDYAGSREGSGGNDNGGWGGSLR